MSNTAICHMNHLSWISILTAEKAFNSLKYVVQVWTICFLRQFSTKYFVTNLQNRLN